MVKEEMGKRLEERMDREFPDLPYLIEIGEEEFHLSWLELDVPREQAVVGYTTDDGEKTREKVYKISGDEADELSRLARALVKVREFSVYLASDGWGIYS